MRILYRAAAIILCAVISVFFIASSPHAEKNINPLPPAPAVTATAAIAGDLKTGEILFKKNEHQRMFPASTTKLLTALVVLDKLSPFDEVKITIPADSAYGKLNLIRGDTVTVMNLLEAMLVISSNDAAELLAERTAGSQEKFAALMNDKAKDLGCLDTHFVTPHGLHDNMHYTTAWDMFIIARAAMNDSRIKAVVGQKESRFPVTKKNPQGIVLKNTNLFLIGNESMPYLGEDIPIQYERVNGVKTGFTTYAGYCLAASGSVKDINALTVVYQADDVQNLYVDSRKLLDYAFTAKGGITNPAPVQVLMDGKAMPMDSYPVIKKGQAYLPLRDIMKWLGMSVTFDLSTETVTGENKEKTIRVQRDNPSVVVDGIRYLLQQAPREYEMRLYVPLEFVPLLIPSDIEWYPEERQIKITTKGALE